MNKSVGFPVLYGGSGSDRLYLSSGSFPHPPRPRLSSSQPSPDDVYCCTVWLLLSVLCLGIYFIHRGTLPSKNHCGVNYCFTIYLFLISAASGKPIAVAMKSANLEAAVPPSDANDTASSTGSEGVILQTGVQRVEAVAKTWTRKALYVAYAGYVLSPRTGQPARQKE